MFMSPFFFVLGILVIVFIFAGYAVNRDHAFKIEREHIRAGNEGSSLGTSELKGLIQEAMSEAIAPMEKRLDLIEGQLRQVPQSSSSRIEFDPEPDEPDESEADPYRSRTR